MGGGGGGGVDAGEDAGSADSGVDSGVPQPFCAMGLSCAEWQDCAPTLDGGACVDGQYTVTWTAPMNGARFAADASVMAQVVVSKSDGGNVPFTTVPLSGAVTGQLDRISAGVYGRALGSLQAPDGKKVLVAGWRDGGSAPEIEVTLDTTGPLMTNFDAGSPPARPATWTMPNDWRRDESVTVVATFSEPVANATLLYGGVSAVGSCVGSACSFVADLWKPTLNGLSGTVAMAVTAVDDVGNSKTSTVSSLNVTRKRWEVAFTGNPEIRAAPALDIRGNIFIGTRPTALTGVVLSLNASDATERWSSSIGAVQSVVVDNANGEVLYAANATGAGIIGGLKTDGGVSGILSSSQISGLSAFAGLGLVSGGSAVGILNSSGTTSGRLCRVTVGDTAACFSAVSSLGMAIGDLDVAAVPGQVESSPNVVVDGTVVFVPTRNGAVVSIQGANGAAPSFLSNKSMGLTKAGAGPWPITGLAALAGASHLAITGQSFLAGVYFAAPGATNVSALDNAFNYGSPIFVGPSVWSGGDKSSPATTQLRRATTGSPGMVAGSASTAGWASASPLAGSAANGATPRVYAFDASGQLTVVREDMPSVAEWNASTGLGEIRAAPTLDCNRLRPNSTTGVLYVASISGKVASYIVDSERLAPTSSWPKYQKDAANSGNTNFTAFPLNPGCP
jgi:hypothetical protein